MKAKFDLNYGSQCGSWDVQNCAQNYRPDQVDTWCCASWCYVDKECPSAIQSLNPGMEGILFWSENVCEDDAALVAQCPFKPQPNVSADDTSCDCLNITMPSSIIENLGLNASDYADYGQQCGPHDAWSCEVFYPNADHDMWCCTSWCWVDASCPSSRASTVWPGQFWSAERCELVPDVVSGCQYNLQACECRGQLPTGSLPDTFATDYGSSCQAWDNASCKQVWGSDADSGWNESSDHEWCCDAWCYVNLECPIAKKSWLGIGYYFSYETCDDPPATYNEGTDTCVATRRLEESAPGGARQLSARRRGGSFSSSRRSFSFSSPRRRAPAATATSPRRRSSSAPSFWSPRRRAPVSPRRRDVRRRAPPPPVPTPLNSRRRTTSMDGNVYSAGSSSVPYGYNSRPMLMNNYGGTMPYQTPYGYSGYNAYPPDNTANIAMYAAGGAVVGAGAMYAYNSMYGDAYNYDSFSRRRFNSFRQPDYCIVNAQGSRYGDFMECQQCFYLYGFASCPSARSCNTAAGCRYTTRQSCLTMCYVYMRRHSLHISIYTHIYICVCVYTYNNDCKDTVVKHTSAGPFTCQSLLGFCCRHLICARTVRAT